MYKPLLLALLALCASAAPAAAQFRVPTMPETGTIELDRGNFTIYQRGQPLGTEHFSVEASGDSLLFAIHTFQVFPGDTLEKDVAWVAGIDFGLRNYMSKQVRRGHTFQRALVVLDSSFTSYRQFDRSGEGDVLALPPGRVFVMEPRVFMCFDVICRSLQGKSFDHRPVSLIMLGAPDTVVEATAENLGSDTLRWGARPTQARKYRISDGNASFIAWASPQGNLLRLEESTSGLRVERTPPVVKRHPARR